MAEPENQRRNEPAEPKLFTLSEISQQTGISMPTLQRYKKLYQGRIPSEGEGRKQRYPETALPVFDEIKNENVGRRGRPRKDASAPRAERAERPAASKRRPGRPAKNAPKSAAKGAAKRPGGRKAAAAAAPAPRPAASKRRPGRPAKAAAAATKGRPARAQKAQKSGNLLTLTQISETTGISYPTLVRYVRLYSDRLPHEGKGRARRFYPQAVDVFRQLRGESGRGGRKKGSGAGAGRAAATGRGRAAAVVSEISGAVSQRLKAIEKSQQSLEKKLKGLVQNLQKLFR
jgi:predicted DNA-binding transcriptional regulator AlpA